MIYNLHNEYDIPKFKERAKALLERGAVVELKERKPERSNAQNRYLHLIIGFFAAKYGCTRGYAKEYFYKYKANEELYYVDKTRKYPQPRSSRELNTEEMSLSITRFRNWSSYEAEIYLPSAEEHEMLIYAEQYVEAHKKYI